MPVFEYVCAALLRGSGSKEIASASVRNFGASRESAMCDGDVTQCAILLRGVRPRQKSASRGTTKLRQVVKRLFVIERCRQHVAGVGQKTEPLLSRLGFRARRLFPNKLRPLFRLPFYLFRLFVEIDKNRDLGAQNFRHDRRENVIDRA